MKSTLALVSFALGLVWCVTANAVDQKKWSEEVDHTAAILGELTVCGETVGGTSFEDESRRLLVSFNRWNDRLGVAMADEQRFLDKIAFRAKVASTGGMNARECSQTMDMSGAQRKHFDAPGTRKQRR